MEYLQIFVKIVLVGITSFLVIRLSGKKSRSKLTPFDILYVMVLGDLMTDAVYDDGISV